MGNRLAFALGCAASTVCWLAPLHAVDDIKTGTDGGAGQSGQSVSANATSTDATNNATATGGRGSGPTGDGGQADATAGTTYAGTSASTARATATGGNASLGVYSGNPGHPGGAANATATGSSNTAPSLLVTANATAGQGSFNSSSGAGGPGGNVSASATGTLLSGGPLTVTVDAFSGSGGTAQFNGGSLGNGGSPGTITLGPISGTATGNATVTARIRGGHGGDFTASAGSGLAARGADGRSVTLNNTVDGTSGATLRLVQEATGGNSGSSFRGNALPHAGDGSSTLDRTAAPGTPVLDLATVGTGGAGGLYTGAAGSIFDRSAGGLGTATSRSRNDYGRALATATGVGGPALTTAVASPGGPASATTQATGLSAAGLGASAVSTATGANAGPGTNGFGSAGGSAAADATAATTGDGATVATATATGGATHSTAFSSAPPSGTATSTASGTATGAAPLTVTARATGGNGSPSTQTNVPAGGAATATASGQTSGNATILAQADAGQGAAKFGLAQATASGTAAGGTVTANAGSPSYGFTGYSISSRAIATTPPLNGARATARAEMAAAAFTPDPATLPQALATANAAPTAAAVNAALSGYATSASRFDTAKSVQLFLLGHAGAQAPAGTTGPVTSTAQLTCATATNNINPSSDRKNLLLALVAPRVTGDGIDSVRLRVVSEGVTIHDVTLLGSPAARAYFTDRVLDLGPIPASVSGNLDVDLLLDVTSSLPGGGFYATLFLGNAAPAPVQTIDQWRTVYFGAGATNTGPAADDANPTGDGSSNLLKYALGLNPNLAYPPGAGVVFDTSTGRNRLTIDRSPSTSNIALTVEGTGNLSPAGTWSTTGLTIQQNTSTRLQVSDDSPLGGPERWLRLRVTRF